jgi:hypothetical protein
MIGATRGRKNYITRSFTKCYYSVQIEEGEVDGACSTNGIEILLGKPEGQRPLMRHRLMWKDNIKMDLKGYCQDRP